MMCMVGEHQCTGADIEKEDCTAADPRYGKQGGGCCTLQARYSKRGGGGRAGGGGGCCLAEGGGGGNVYEMGRGGGGGGGGLQPHPPCICRWCTVLPHNNVCH